MGFFENSIFLRYSKNISQGYLYIEEKISFVYSSSFSHWLTRKGAALIKIGFKFSIFGRLRWIEEDKLRNFFATSKIIKAILIWKQNLKAKLTGFFVTSCLFTSTTNLKRDFFSQPLQVGGAIIIITITINSILSIILQKQIILGGWIMRGLFLFVGISGLFCNADWENIKNTSLVLRYIEGLLRHKSS